MLFESGGLSSSDLQCREPRESVLISLDKLTSIMDISFHILGGGSMRHSELEKTLRSRLSWHAGTIYYSSLSEKTWSSLSMLRDPTCRKIPPPLARVYLIYLVICWQFQLEGEFAIVWRAKPTTCSRKTFRDLFRLTSPPSYRDMRQFSAQISNKEFGDIDWQVVSARGLGATTFSHDESTHAGSYQAFLEGGSEAVFQQYHSALGLVRVSLSDSPLVPADLKDGLRALGYSNFLPHQERLCSFVAFPDGKHTMAVVPCGGGKSMAWLLPLVAALVKGKPTPMTIVVHPYVFLSQFHCSDAISKLSNRFECGIACLTLADFATNTSLPAILGSSDALPSLLFVSLEAASQLVRFHGQRLRELKHNS